MKKESIERCMKAMEHCNGIMHTVRSGDTLYSISMEHKVPLALLLRANPYVDVYNLQVGETICVPVRGNAQGMMPPYGSSCSKWEVRDAVPVTAEEKRDERKMPEERENRAEQTTIEKNSETAEESTGKEESMVMEGTEQKKEERKGNVYVTKEGDSLEDILGVDRILLRPGITFYRQK